MWIKEDFTTPQPDIADSRYSKTTRIPSTSLYETTSFVSIDSENIGSNGKLLYVKGIF